MGIAYIAGYNFQVGIGRDIFEPAPIVKTVVVGQGAYLVAFFEEEFG